MPQFSETTLPIYDEVQGRPLSEKEAKEKAFYLASQSTADVALDVYNTTYDELTQTGYSPLYSNAENAYQQEEDEKRKVVIANVISDPSIDKKQKERILRQYTVSGFVPKTLENKYIEDIAILELGQSMEEIEAQDENIDALNDRLNANKIEAIEDNTTFLKSIDEDYAKPVSAEAAAIVGNLGVGTIKGFFGEFLYKLAGVTVDLLKGKKVDVARYQKEWEENTKNSKVIDWFHSLDPKFLAKWMGVEKEFDEAYTTEALNWVGGEFELIAEKAVEKGIAKDKETALFTMESIGMMIPFAWKGTTAGLNRLKHPKESIASKTITANPKAAGDTMAIALKESDGPQLADAMGTTTDAIIAENVIPKFGNEKAQVGPVPDINRRLKQMEGMSDADKIIYDSLFDDTLINSEVRFKDFERRLNVANNTKVYHNQAASTFLMTKDRLQGNMVFTQTPDYPFRSRRAVEHGLKQLQNAVKNLEEPGTFSIRDLKTNKLYTLDQYTKSKAKGLEKGEFQIEYDFNQTYDILDNPVITDSRMDSEEITMLGGLSTGNYKTSAFSEYFSGQGFYPRWLEISRRAIGEKAENLLSRTTGRMNQLAKANKDINKYMGAVALKMEAKKTDLFTAPELANLEYKGKRLGDILSQEQLNRLDTMQKEWRSAQDILYEITNQGEKTRLLNEGYDKGIYVNNKPTLMFAKEIKFIDANDIPTEVLDIDTGKIVRYVPDESKGNVITAKSAESGVPAGKQLVRLHRREVDDFGVSTDYALVGAKGKSELKMLPTQVVNKLPGHYHKQYESHFFIRVKPTYVRHNGIEYGKGTNKAVPDDFVEVKGTATTRYEADQLVREMSDPESPNYVENAQVLEPVRAQADSLTDHLAAYKVETDNYRNALTRAEDIRTLNGDTVIMDPLRAMNESARRIYATAAGSQFETVFQEKFKKDFSKVIPGDKTGDIYPTSIDQISVSAKNLPASPELLKLEAEAKSAWRRHDHFTQAGEVNVFDRAWFNGLQSLGDFLERGRYKLNASEVRKLAGIGLTGLSAQGKALATRLMITYVLPMRHWAIQPMMALEQAVTFPKTYKATMQRAPLLTQELLGFDVSLQKKALLRSAEARKQYDLELKALKESNVLESINQNLAAHEVLGRRVTGFDEGTTLPGKILRPIQNVEGTGAAVFNKVGFASGELANRVAMFIQNKERWRASNVNKDWTTKPLIQDFAQSAWEQSGAMTRAGALQFQRQPILSFLTQFQAINVKGLMNVLQDNATNLTRGERARLTGVRMLLHGVKYGTIGGLGKAIYDYFANHNDPEVQANAELLQKGFLDLFIQSASELIMDEESDVSISESASINATNAPIEVLQGLFQTFAFFTGDRQAQAPNIPFNKAVGRILESVSKAEDIFKHRDLTGDSMFDAMAALTEMTSAGSNIAKARRAWRMHDLYTKNGYAKGLEITKTDAFWQAFGFRTYKEAELQRGEELKRSSTQRVKDAISDLDSVFVNVFTGTRTDAETKFKLLNTEINLLRQEGKFSGSELNEIFTQVLSRQGSRAMTTRSGSLFTYLLNTDGRTEDAQAIINILKNVKKNDPVLQDYYDMIVNKKLTPIKE